MPDSRRLTVVKALQSVLQGMTAENGYTVVPTSVYLGRRQFSDQQSKPFITVVEKPEQPEASETAGQDYEFQRVTLAVFGYVQGDHDDDPVSPAYELLAEIQRCLRPAQENRLGGNVISFHVEPGYVWQDDKTGVTYCHVNVTARIRENTADPYELS